MLQICHPYPRKYLRNYLFHSCTSRKKRDCTLYSKYNCPFFNLTSPEKELNWTFSSLTGFCFVLFWVQNFRKLSWIATSCGRLLKLFQESACLLLLKSHTDLQYKISNKWNCFPLRGNSGIKPIFLRPLSLALWHATGSMGLSHVQSVTPEVTFEPDRLGFKRLACFLAM